MPNSVVLFFIPFYVTGVLLLLAALGIILSAFAAVILWKMAQDRDLSSGRYAMAGAVYSTFLLLPLLYLIVSLRGERVPASLIASSYISVYASWLVGPFGLIYVMYPFVDNPIPTVVLISVIAMAAAWIVSLAVLLGVLDWILDELAVPYSPPPEPSLLPALRYVAPFGLVAASAVVSVAMVSLVWIGIVSDV